MAQDPIPRGDGNGLRPGEETKGLKEDGLPTAKSPAPLASSLIHDIERAGKTPWLIENVWTAQGVGIVGGTPKTGKTWFALDLALSVASGTCALGRFQVLDPGPVVLYPAEDGPSSIRGRIDGLALARGVAIEGLPLHVITAESLRLDDGGDRASLEHLLEAIRPKLLILDPLVRLHAGSENDAGHVSRLLGYLRVVQRRFSVAIMVTHHVSKKAATHPGQALRGSSDLHAWGDSNAYLQRRKSGSVMLTLEHRSAASPEPLALRLVMGEGQAMRLELGELDQEMSEGDDGGGGGGGVKKTAPVQATLGQRIVLLLKQSAGPLSQVAIRRALRVRNAHLTAELRSLQEAGDLVHLGRMGGWMIGGEDAPEVEADAQS